MSLVTELRLPEIDYNTPDFGPATYHARLAAARAAEPGWLAHSPLAYIVLDAVSGDFFLRSREARFPGQEIAEIFGVTSGPLAEHVGKNILNATGEQHRRLRNLVAPAFTPRNADRWRPAMRAFLAELWDTRGDLISQLLAAEDRGDRLTRDELTELVLNVIAGGIDTTQSQLAHAVRIFAAHPDQWRLLAGDPDAYAPRAVTEVLRFEPVAPFTARIILSDLEHRGVTFPAGTIVAVCAERANRDQPGGEDFDITADRDGRLFTFSAGAHYCLGANFARAELEEALKFLAPRMPALALDGEPVLGGVEGIYNVESLPVRWD